MKTEEELKKMFVEIISDFHKSDISNEICLWDEIIEDYMQYDYGEILKTKTYNLLNLMNETRNKSEEEFIELIKRDIETDIWYII